MNHPVGAEIEATAQWLEQRGANGAANALRRVAHQRDRARDRGDDALDRAYRYRLAWRSARRRAERHAASSSEPSRNLAKLEYLFNGKVRPSAQPVQEVYRENAMMRIDLALFQNLVERAGWMPDATIADRLITKHLSAAAEAER